eukprot:TRINITY_DN2190_c0_g1::TRINITY_DN2190_c0_g1_i2::g.12712::m.12712 TRINITY_DN2190_c0_g1::TRINITY_DN2190_c0_g1_i2::g.12712  ORF type:complete len:117 (-),score=-17.97,X/PF00739.14/7.4e+02,X/PF00739.14/0.84 TRINITY_DN2190_c0_g1_i2:56-406(-)
MPPATALEASIRIPRSTRPRPVPLTLVTAARLPPSVSSHSVVASCQALGFQRPQPTKEASSALAAPLSSKVPLSRLPRIVFHTSSPLRRTSSSRTLASASAARFPPAQLLPSATTS